MVLLDDNFASIVNAIEEGRAVFDNIRKFLTYVLVHNVAELVPYLGFLLFKIPLALTPIQALSIDMGSDSLTALGLGVERADPQIMQRPPRPESERLMNWSVALRAYLFLGLIEAAAAMAVFFFVLHRGGLAVRSDPCGIGSRLPAGDDRLLEHHHRAADRQRVPVQKRDAFGVVDRIRRQRADHALACCRRSRSSCCSTIRRGPIPSSRNGAHRGRGVEFHRPLRGGHVRVGRGAQVGCP